MAINIGNFNLIRHCLIELCAICVNVMNDPFCELLYFSKNSKHLKYCSKKIKYSPKLNE